MRKLEHSFKDKKVKSESKNLTELNLLFHSTNKALVECNEANWVSAASLVNWVKELLRINTFRHLWRICMIKSYEYW